MRRLLVFLPLLAACPAPEPVDLGQLAEPSIELLYPPQGEQLIRKADGSIEFLVVVDIDDMVFDKELAGTAPEFGTGHYHVWLENTHIGSPEDLSFDVVHLAGDDPSLQSASEVHVRVSLQHNDHSDYELNEDGTSLAAWEAIIAYDIVDE